MEFEPAIYPECECVPVHRLAFFGRERYRFSLGFTHLLKLRSEYEEPWVADAVLTPRSRDAIIAWFQREGFGTYAEMRTEDVARQEREAREFESITELFPERVRSWFPKEGSGPLGPAERRGADLAGQFSDRTDLIHTCWKALGRALKRQVPESVSYSAPAHLLFGALSSITPEEVARALEELPEGDAETWLGAYVHLDPHAVPDGSRLWYGPLQKGPWLFAKSAASWPLRLARRFLTDGPESLGRRAVDTLATMDTPEADELLIEVARGGLIRTGHADDSERMTKLGRYAAVVLARKGHPAASEIVEQKLSELGAGERDLDLEVAAAYSGRRSLGVEHVIGRPTRRTFDLAEKTLPPEDYVRALETVAARASPWVFYVDDNPVEEATKRLGVMGVAVPTLDERIKALPRPCSEGQAFIDDCTALAAAETNGDLADAILSWRGEALLRRGDYELAYADLRRGWGFFTHQHLIAAFAAGELATVARNDWAVMKGRTPQERQRTRLLSAAAVYLLGNASTPYADTDMRSTWSSTERLEADMLVLLGRVREWRADFRRHALASSNVPEGIPGTFERVLKDHVLGRAAERDVLSLTRSAHERFLGHWVLAELALLDGRKDKARRHLAVCLESRQYTHPLYLVARHRWLDLKMPE